MKTKFILLCLFYNVLMAGALHAQKAGSPVVPAASVIKDTQALLSYYSRYLRLKEDFRGYDASMHPIAKNVFLQKLSTGNYLPLRLYAQGGTGVYRLYKLPANADFGIKRMLKQIGDTYYSYTLVEGKKLPRFRFQDLNGNVYTPENTRGKVIVLKAWYLACVPCVAEMPLLNQFREEYRNRKDILFLSIAFDSRKALQRFARRTTFKYAIIPVTAKFIEHDLHATGYPVHWIINKQGIVTHMTYEHNEIIAALRKEAAK